jgi:hypothetical protein
MPDARNLQLAASMLFLIPADLFASETGVYSDPIAPILLSLFAHSGAEECGDLIYWYNFINQAEEMDHERNL